MFSPANLLIVEIDEIEKYGAISIEEFVKCKVNLKDQDIFIVTHELT